MLNLKHLKLSQVLALETAERNSFKDTINAADKAGSNSTKSSGRYHKYHPKDEADDDLLPEDRVIVEVKYVNILRDLFQALPSFVDITGAKDFTNTVAKANVMVGDVCLIEGAPVPFLLFLEKQMSDLRTLVGRMVEPDPSETWTWDANQQIHVSGETKSQRTVKETVALVLHPGTDKHPPQTTTTDKTIIKGTWDKVRLSGAIPGTKKRILLSRLDTLIAAVKVAREEANSTKVVYTPVGEALAKFIFDGV